MPRNTPQAWVQSVYNQWVQRGITLGNLSPILNTFFTTLQPRVHNQSGIPHTIPRIHTQLFTLKNHQFNLLNTWLYPQSTAPIINKKKEI